MFGLALFPYTHSGKLKVHSSILVTWLLCRVFTDNIASPLLYPPSQLEESNRTLTVDVANLASEKEELNNQLKEMQQSERHSSVMSNR